MATTLPRRDSSERLKDIEEKVRAVQKQAYDVDERLEMMDREYRAVPTKVGEVENKLADKCNQLDDLDWRSKVHSAKIKALQTDLQYAKRHAHSLKDRVLSERLHALSETDPEGQETKDKGRDKSPDSGRRGDTYARGTGTPVKGDSSFRDVARKDDSGERKGGTSGERYLGMDRYYNPDLITSYRYGHGPEYTYRPTMPEDPSKYFKFDEPRHLRNHDILAEKSMIPTYDETGPRTYDKAFVNPRAILRPERPVGGFYFIRFRDSGYEAVRVALTRLKTVIHSSDGHLMGIARKDRIFVLEGSGDWALTRDDGRGRYRTTENAMAVLWFSSKEKCDEFFCNTFRNPFKEHDFPTQHGYESFYLPLLAMPVFEAFPTFLFVELLDANRYKEEDLTQFEAEVRHEISRQSVRSLPVIISKMRGLDYVKPGPYVGKWKVKVFVSRFQNQKDVDYIWGLGIIQEKIRKYNFDRGLHVASFSILD